jgi:hypothetical protein
MLAEYPNPDSLAHKVRKERQKPDDLKTTIHAIKSEHATNPKRHRESNLE